MASLSAELAAERRVSEEARQQLAVARTEANRAKTQVSGVCPTIEMSLVYDNNIMCNEEKWMERGEGRRRGRERGRGRGRGREGGRGEGREGE